ncbi:MAG: DUF2306 domain-containing protein [Gammaproteobacteria bacterium]|nr:DUF2306 domain-containing protein [Gammaproteobacteria bacterium]
MSTTANRVALPTGAEGIFVRALRLVFAVACVAYAVMAFDYFIGYTSGREGLWLRLFTALTSPEHGLGAGSVHVEQAAPYRAGLPFMLMHTMMGALCLAVGPFQFSAAVRRRYPYAHRAMGRVYLVSAVMSMIGGLLYLGTTSFAEVYAGKPFALALTGLDLMVLFSAWLAYAAIRRREVRRHQAWMAFNFGLILATPALRLFWILFGWFAPGLDQEQANMAITTFLLPLCLFATLAWMSVQYPRRRAAGAAS